MVRGVSGLVNDGLNARVEGGRFFWGMSFMVQVIREHALPPFRCIGWEQNDDVIDDQCVNKMGVTHLLQFISLAARERADLMGSARASLWLV